MVHIKVSYAEIFCLFTRVGCIPSHFWIPMPQEARCSCLSSLNYWLSPGFMVRRSHIVPCEIRFVWKHNKINYLWCTALHQSANHNIMLFDITCMLSIRSRPTMQRCRSHVRVSTWNILENLLEVRQPDTHCCKVLIFKTPKFLLILRQ